MANQAGYFNIQEFSDAGALLVGGRLYTYTYGTTTHKIAYTDADGLVSQTYTSDGAGGFYIALDARGELPAPLYLTTGSYDLALKTAAGATIWTRRADPAGSSTFSTPTTFSSTVTFEDNVTFEENVTIEGDLTVEGDSIFEGDATFEGDVDMSSATSVEYLDGSITINDLDTELVNILLGGSISSGGGFLSGDGRLSLSSTEKVMVIDYTAITTLYYVGGTVVSYNDSGTFRPFKIGTVLSNTLADATYSPAASAANKAYDALFWVRSIVVASITRSGTTATVTTTGNHGITTDAVVFIAGCDQEEYNGYQTLLSGSGTTFTFTVDVAAVTPATGSITCQTGQLSKSVAWRNRGQAITDASETTPVVITATAHGLSTGDSAYVSNLVGITGVSDAYYTVTVLTADTFSLGGTVGGGTYAVGTGSFSARGVGAGTAQIELNGNSYVNSVAVTNGPGAGLGTVLGSFMTNGSNQLDWKLGTPAANGGPAWLSVWNISNQVVVRPLVQSTTNTWTYNAVTVRPMDNSTTWRITAIAGIPINTLDVQIITQIETAEAATGGLNMIGLNSTSVQAPRSNAGTCSGNTGPTDINFNVELRYVGNPGLGVYYIQALEAVIGTTNTITWHGTSGSYTTVPAYETTMFGQFLM